MDINTADSKATALRIAGVGTVIVVMRNSQGQETLLEVQEIAYALIGRSSSID